MRVFLQLLFIAVLAAGGSAVWHYKEQIPFLGPPAAQSKPASGPRPTLVEVAPARSGRVTTIVQAIGTANATESVVVTSKVSGIVTRIDFREGDKVKAGLTLIELDATALQAELEEKRAERDNARSLLARAQKLLKSRNVAEARVEELTALLKAAEARVRADEARLRDYVVKAPFSGRLGMRRVSLGALVEPGDEITTLDDTNPIKLDFEIPENVLGRASRGKSVKATSVAYPGRVFEGRIVTIGSRIDQVTRAISVRAEVANPDEALKPGMALTVSMETQVREGAVLVPEEAVVTSGQSHFVFIVEGDKAARKRVVLGQRLSGEVEVVEGLEAGMLTVIGGIQKVRDGGPVKLLNDKKESEG